MEQYYKSKPAVFLYNLNTYKASIWVALLILAIMHSKENWPVSIYLAVYELLFSLGCCLVLRVFCKYGKGTKAIKTWCFLRFLVYCVLLIANIFMIIMYLIRMFNPSNASIQNSDPLLKYFSISGTLTIIVLVVVYLIVSFIIIRIMQYYYWMFQTFSHMQKEQKSNQLLTYEYKEYRLVNRANTVSLIILIAFLLVAGVFVFTIIAKIPLNLRNTSVISIGLFGYLGYLITSPITIMAFLLFMYTEVTHVAKLAKVYQDIHDNIQNTIST